MTRRKFTVKFPMEIIEPLQALLKEHPELGFDTPAEVAKRALVEFTNQLRRQVAETETPDEKGEAPLEPDEVVALLERYYQDRRRREVAARESSSGAKRSR